MAVAKGKSTYKDVIKKAKTDTIKRLDLAFQDTCVEAVDRCADLTPVDTGAAINHWFLRRQPNENFDKERTDPEGELSKDRARRDVLLFRAGQIVYAVNAAPYFKYLEDGSSTQAPHGVVKIVKAQMGLFWSKRLKFRFSEDPKSGKSGRAK